METQLQFKYSFWMSIYFKDRKWFSSVSSFYPRLIFHPYLCKLGSLACSSMTSTHHEASAKVKHCREEEACDNQTGHRTAWIQYPRSKNPPTVSAWVKTATTTAGRWNQKLFKKENGGFTQTYFTSTFFFCLVTWIEGVVQNLWRDGLTCVVDLMRNIQTVYNRGS